MLGGAASANAAPSVTFSCSPAPQDCRGWYRSDVSIDWTVLPSSASRTGCQDKTYRADTAGTGRGRRRLLSPTKGAVVSTRRPPLLRWTPVRGARYYNVQLFGKGRKILSVWPTLSSYQLMRRWTYRAELRRLVPGRYGWLVWPGFGPRSRADYGRRIGPSSFVVRRDRAL
jgi:hypothetical protein